MNKYTRKKANQKEISKTTTKIAQCFIELEFNHEWAVKIITRKFTGKKFVISFPPLFVPFVNLYLSYRSISSACSKEQEPSWE